MQLNPASNKFIRLRNTVRFILTALLILAHAFFVGGIVFYNDIFARKFAHSTTLTTGIVATVAVIVFMLLLEFIYIFISQRWLDPMQKKLQLEAENETS